MTCDKDWRTCGHCKAGFDGPFGHEVRPYCDDAGFLDTLTGGDWCPNAPWPGSDDNQTEEGE